MEEGTVNNCLNLWVVEDADLDIQKCYMAPEAIVRLQNPQFMVRDFVKFTTDNHSFICSVWPKSHLDENTVKVNKCVKTVSRIRHHSDNRDSQHHTIKVLKTEKAALVKVKLVIDKVENVAKLKKKLKNGSGHIQQLISECMFRLCVAPGYVIELTKLRYAKLIGVTAVIVTQVHCDTYPDKVDAFYPDTVDAPYIDTVDDSHQHMADAYTIDKKTVIEIDSVQSKEWFDQRIRTNSCKIGGLDSVVNMLTDLIKLPLKHRTQFHIMGVDPPRGILLQGPPGCGKTTIVQHVSNICGAFLTSVNGPEIYGPHPGETESNLRNIFKKAVLMSQEGPCILFIDEIDSVCPRKGGSGGVQEARVTGQFLTLLDWLKSDSDVVVIAATNRPGALDPAVRRPGRLDREVLINVPTKTQRRDILLSHLSDLHLVTSDLDLDYLADVTNGYVGADLGALCHEAAYIAMDEGKRSQNRECKIRQDHFVKALKKMCPSLHRSTEVVVDVRPVSWDNIGGLSDVKQQIKQAVEWPLKHPEAFERMGLPSPRGILLYGPPGCCKTTLVRAAATACHTTFLSVSGAQVFSPYVGDAERFISEVFQKARALAPSILFLDEIDSMVGKRSDTGTRGVQERVLSTLLNEMDGIGVRLDEKIGASIGDQRLLEGDKQATPSPRIPTDNQSKLVPTDNRSVLVPTDNQSVLVPTDNQSVLVPTDNQSVLVPTDNRSVLVVAATNRPDLLDEALVRPGRFDKVVYVPHPDTQARLEILKLYTSSMVLCDVALDELADQTEWYTGADLESLCREAALAALSEDLDATSVHKGHFTKALNSVKPSLNEQLVKQYSNMNLSTFKHAQIKR